MSAQTCPTSNEITITVNPVLNITANLSTTSQTVCVGGTVVLTVTTSGGSGGTLNYVWQSDASGSFAPIAGAPNSNSYTVPTTTAGAVIKYRVVITDPASSASACGSKTSAETPVQVAPDLSFGTNLSTTEIKECIGGTRTLTVVVTGGTVAASSLTYVWEESNSNSPYSWHAAPSASSTNTYQPPSSTAGTKYYQVRVQDPAVSAAGCGDATSAITPVTVTPDLTFTTSLTNITECIGGTDQLSVVTTGGTGGVLTYTWEESDIASPYSWHAAPGASTSSATYTAPSTAAGTKYYRVTVTDAASGCDPLISPTPATVVINAKPTMTIATAEGVVCEGGAVAFVATVTNPGVGCTIQWQKNTTAAPTVFNDIPSATGANYTTPALTTGSDNGTKYKAHFVCSGSGCCN